MTQYTRTSIRRLIVEGICTLCFFSVSPVNAAGVIDNFDNPPDKVWEFTSEYTSSLVTFPTFNNSARSRFISWNKLFNAYPIARITGIFRSFRDDTFFSMEVFPVGGPVTILAKVRDIFGRETGDIGIVTAQPDRWNHVVWNYKDVNKTSGINMDWINEILFFVEPGRSFISGSMYVDNLVLGDLSTVMTISEKRNLLIDDFNDGSDPNLLGGKIIRFPGDSSLSTIYFDGNQEQIRGRSGKSLQVIYNSVSLPGFHLSLPNLNVTPYGSLTFWLKGADGGESFWIGLEDAKKSALPDLSVGQFLPAGVTRNWQKVVVPISALGGSGLFESFRLIERDQIKHISFQFFGTAGQERQIYVDDVLFETVASPLWVDNFEWLTANILGNPIGTGGFKGGLGVGGITFISTPTAQSGFFSGRITTARGGNFDDFNDGSDPANYGGIYGVFNGGIAGDPSPTLSYDAANARGGSGFCLKLDYDVDNGDTNNGIFNSFSARNVSGDFYSFYVKGSTGGEKLLAAIKGGGQEPKKDITPYIVGGSSITTFYQRVVIPVSVFQATAGFSMGSLDVFSFTFDSRLGGVKKGTVYIDDIEMIPGDGAFFTANKINVAQGLDTFSFYARGVAGGESMRVRLEEGSNRSNELPVVPISLSSSSWKKYSFNISDFTGIDKTKVGAIHMMPLKSGSTVFIDNILFENSGTPTGPSNLKADDSLLAVNTELPSRVVLSATANSSFQDAAMEAVRFEYSTDNATWITIGTDYDVSDNTYFTAWNTSKLVSKGNFYVRAVSQSTDGDEGLPGASAISSGISFKTSDIILYPSPFYPRKGSGTLNFTRLPENAIVDIYTLTGELISSLKDDGALSDKFLGDGLISWNGRSALGGDLIASGIYFYVVKVGNERIARGKFAVIK